MSSECQPDFGRTATDYATHRAGFPGELIDRLAAMGIAVPGMRVVDLGTGTGSLARLFARQGCEVTGVDIAAPLLEQALGLDRAAGTRIDYVNAPAEASGLPDGAFDVVCAGQCWHWFDRPAAAREVARLLVRDGTVVIAHFDWLPIPSNVVAATEEIILSHTPSWPYAARAGLYPQWLTDLQSAGFTHIETFSFDLDVPYTHEAWVGRVRASAPIAGTLDQAGVNACSRELQDMLAERFPADPLAVPHRVWAVTATAPGGRPPDRGTLSIEASGNLRLRTVQESDATELHALIASNRDHLSRWMAWPSTQTFDDTLRFIRSCARQLAENDGFQAAILRDQKIVGVAGFHGVDWARRSTSIGYWLAEEQQGQGTMSSAVRALLDHAFEVWRLNRVEVRIAPDNERSRALAIRLGFRQEGTLRAAERIGERYLDSVVYSLLDSDRGRAAPG